VLIYDQVLFASFSKRYQLAQEARMVKIACVVNSAQEA